MLRPVGFIGRGPTPFANPNACASPRPPKLPDNSASLKRNSPRHICARCHANVAAAAAAVATAASSGATSYCGTGRAARCRQLCPDDVSKPFHKAWRNLPWRNSSGKRTVARSMLQQIDYSFYNEIESRGGVITEELLWERLRPLLDYLSPEARQKVQEALSLAYDAHGGQARRSGEKYVTHPLEVARILAELHMDCDSLVAGLLHDTVEDTNYVTLEEIGLWFGAGVMRIVEGETRFSKLGHLTEAAPPGASHDLKAIDLQQLFLAMTDEVRIIVVKLADRLHNMRTLGSMPSHKQRKIADETLRVFAPLARLLGLYSIKEELEALSFLYTHPAEHTAMVKQINRLREQQRPAVEAAMAALEQRLDDDPYLKDHIARCSINFHTKALYSLHRKQQLSGRPVKELRDVAQLQVVIQPLQGRPPVDDRQLCYHVMGLVHTMWAPIPGKVKDYIATPKPNGYQSIHTTVLPVGIPNLVPLEVHMRTAAMHRLAQYGVAAEQWPYPACGTAQRPSPTASPSAPKPVNGLVPQCTAGQQPLGASSLPRAVNGFASWPEAEGEAGRSGDSIEGHVTDRHANWLSSIREWQEEFLSTMPPREFVDCVTDDLFGKGVFVFTPSGQSMRLPKGATVVDFAYHVHTDIGNHMKGAIVNGAAVTPDHRLSNAEVVEIVHDSGTDGCSVTAVDVLRHKRWQPATRSARHKVAQFIKAHEHLLHPDPESPDGRMMSHGILDRVLDMGHPRSAAASAAATAAASVTQGGSVTWLLVRCSDRPAMLADIAQRIASHGHNIVSYEGRGCPLDDANQSFMRFAVTGDLRQQAAMFQAMRATDGVASVEDISGASGPLPDSQTARNDSQTTLPAPPAAAVSSSSDENAQWATPSQSSVPFGGQTVSNNSQTASRGYSGKWGQTQESDSSSPAHKNGTSQAGSSEEQQQQQQQQQQQERMSPTHAADNAVGIGSSISGNRPGADSSSNNGSKTFEVNGSKINSSSSSNNGSNNNSSSGNNGNSNSGNVSSDDSCCGEGVAANGRVKSVSQSDSSPDLPRQRSSRRSNATLRQHPAGPDHHSRSI